MDRTTYELPTSRCFPSEMDGSVKTGRTGTLRQTKFSILPPTQFISPELESPNGPLELCFNGDASSSSPTCHSPKPAWDMDTLKHSICSARTGTGEVQQIIESCTFKPREAAFTTLINMCGQLRDWKKAVEVFEAMQYVKGVKSNRYTYSVLIAACSSSGEWVKALEIFQQMKSAAKIEPDCTPNEFTYSSLITACERGGQYEKALEVYDEMIINNVPGDHITFSSVLTACEKSRNWPRAESVLQEMHKRGLHGNAVIYSELLVYYMERQDWLKALSTCQAMQKIRQESQNDTGKKSSQYSTNRSRSKGPKSTEIITPSNLILPNAKINPLITSQSPRGDPILPPSSPDLDSQDSSTPRLPIGAGQLQGSHHGLGGRAPWDMESLKRAICFAKTGTGEVQRAFECCTFRPREQAFTALINMCGRLRDWKKAIEVFKSMKFIRGITPNTYIYSSLIAACSSSGEWEKALEIFDTMKNQARFDRNCVPNEVTYSALITACQRGGMFDRALELYNEMIQSGVKPDQITYSSVLAACEKSERWDRVEEILDRMHSQGICGPQGIYSELISHYGEFGAFNKALQVHLTVKMLGQQPDDKMRKALMRALNKSEQWDLMIEFFKEIQETGKPVDPELVNLVIQAQERINNHHQPIVGGYGGRIANSRIPALVHRGNRALTAARQSMF
eukprot:g8740.t1